MALAVDVLSCASVTVSVTSLAPISEHWNIVLSTETALMPHASEDPLFISDAVMLAMPFTRVTVIFFVITCGRVVSATVTIALPVAVFPLLSVIVNTTGLLPIDEQ